MDPNKALKNIGWVFVIVGLLAFNASYFLGNYDLSRAHFENLNGMTPEKMAALEGAGMNFSPGPETLPFGIDRDIVRGFEKANQALIEDYLITESQIIDLERSWETESGYKIDLNRLHSGSDWGSPLDSIRVSLFLEYGSWLDGREYDRKEPYEGETLSPIKKDLSIVRENIAKYGIIDQLGFQGYWIKDATYELLNSSYSSPPDKAPWTWFGITFFLCSVGGILIFYSGRKKPVSSQNDSVMSKGISNRGIAALLLGVYLIGFYIVLYFFQEYMVPFVRLSEPVSQLIKSQPAGPFFLYGLIYTLVILVMALRMWYKYRHTEYQKWRTISVSFFQLAFAFLIPEILVGLNRPYYDFKNIWPLDYDFFFESNLSALIQSGGLGVFMLVWGIALIIVGVPVMTYFFGKRWYCSWVCGCGGLAETAGDPFRHLSDKSLKAWKVERYLIHGVMVFAVVMTGLVLYTYFTGQPELFGLNSFKLREVYGAWIGAGFAGVVGTGFYPLMGNRVWCRFGCPLAAYLGMVQRFKSRFRITTNGGQCISCGNCSTYCEMGIDVRWYAQRGQNIVRSSCVGCGICSAVCPRGVLNLETMGSEGRLNNPTLTGQDPAINDLQLPMLPPIKSKSHS